MASKHLPPFAPVRLKMSDPEDKISLPDVKDFDAYPGSERGLANSKARNVTYAGLGANVAISGLKFYGGAAGGSMALMADGVHSLSDAATDIAVLVGMRFWNKPPDETHPHGHRKIETLVTTIIGTALGIAAVGMIFSAATSISNGVHLHPGWGPLSVALMSIIIKEWIYRWTYRTGREIKSMAVMANAWHHRSDALSSIPVAIAIGLSIANPVFGVLDPVGALVVGVFIIQAAWKILRPALWELADAGVSESVCREIEQVTLETDGVRDVHAVRTRTAGAELLIDLHVLVDPELTVLEGHEIAKAVKENLKSRIGAVDALVHLEPHVPGK